MQINKNLAQIKVKLQKLKYEFLNDHKYFERVYRRRKTFKIADD